MTTLFFEFNSQLEHAQLYSHVKKSFNMNSNSIVLVCKIQTKKHKLISNFLNLNLFKIHYPSTYFELILTPI